MLNELVKALQHNHNEDCVETLELNLAKAKISFKYGELQIRHLETQIKRKELDIEVIILKQEEIAQTIQSLEEDIEKAKETKAHTEAPNTH
jgi:exonuclease VII small subunit